MRRIIEMHERVLAALEGGRRSSPSRGEGAPRVRRRAVRGPLSGHRPAPLGRGARGDEGDARARLHARARLDRRQAVGARVGRLAPALPRRRRDPRPGRLRGAARGGRRARRRAAARSASSSRSPSRGTPLPSPGGKRPPRSARLSRPLVRAGHVRLEVLGVRDAGRPPQEALGRRRRRPPLRGSWRLRRKGEVRQPVPRGRPRPRAGRRHGPRPAPLRRDAASSSSS